MLERHTDPMPPPNRPALNYSIKKCPKCGSKGVSYTMLFGLYATSNQPKRRGKMLERHPDPMSSRSRCQQCDGYTGPGGTCVCTTCPNCDEPCFESEIFYADLVDADMCPKCATETEGE